MPMMKYIGTSMISQNMKNRNRSSATNTPSTPVCSSSIIA
jgi:hypothetical protein